MSRIAQPYKRGVEESAETSMTLWAAARFTIFTEMTRTFPPSRLLLMVIMMTSMHRKIEENVETSWVTQLRFKLEPSLIVLELNVKGRRAIRAPELQKLLQGGKDKGFFSIHCRLAFELN